MDRGRRERHFHERNLSPTAQHHQSMEECCFCDKTRSGTRCGLGTPRSTLGRWRASPLSVPTPLPTWCGCVRQHGMSLWQSGTKASCVLCITPDAQEAFYVRLLSAFWEIRPIEHTELPPHLRGTEMERQAKVHTKIALWSEFGKENKKMFVHAPGSEEA